MAKKSTLIVDTGAPTTHLDSKRVARWRATDGMATTLNLRTTKD